jgi:hypothetical protein
MEGYLKSQVSVRMQWSPMKMGKSHEGLYIRKELFSMKG